MQDIYKPNPEASCPCFCHYEASKELQRYSNPTVLSSSRICDPVEAYNFCTSKISALISVSLKVKITGVLISP